MLKKGLFVFFATLMLFSICSAEGYDLGSLGFDELLALKQYVDAEVMSREESGNSVLVPGEYVAGKDIKPGRYYLLFDIAYDPFMDCRYAVYNNVDKEKRLESGDVYSGGDSVCILLQDGNLLVLEDGSVKICVVDFPEEMKAIERLPEDVKEIPTGEYIVGEDFPAGKYDVFVTARHGGEITVYESEEKYKAEDIMQRLVLGLNRGESRQGVIRLEEGNVLLLSEGPLYMRKAAGISFE